MVMPPLSQASRLARNTRRAAIGGSLGYVLVVLITAVWAYGPADLAAGLVSVQIGPWLWWALLGGAVVGAVLAVTVARYGLVSPLLSVTLVYGVAMYRMWQALQSPNPLLPGTPLDLYLVGWPLLLVVAIGSGLVERRVRTTAPPAENSNTG